VSPTRGLLDHGEHVVVDLRQEVWYVKIVTIRLSMIATVVAQNLLQLKAVQPIAGIDEI